MYKIRTSIEKKLRSYISLLAHLTGSFCSTETGNNETVILYDTGHTCCIRRYLTPTVFSTEGYKTGLLKSTARFSTVRKDGYGD